MLSLRGNLVSFGLNRRDCGMAEALDSNPRKFVPDEVVTHDMSDQQGHDRQSYCQLRVNGLTKNAGGSNKNWSAYNRLIAEWRMTSSQRTRTAQMKTILMLIVGLMLAGCGSMESHVGNRDAVDRH